MKIAMESTPAALDAGSVAGSVSVGPPASTRRSNRLALAALSLAMLLSSLGTGLANVSLPALSAEFEVSLAAVQWVVVAYLLASTAVMVSVGRLGDVLGRRRLLLAGLAIHLAASIACAASPGLAALVAARAVQGMAAAVLMAQALAAIGDLVPRESTGRAMGLLGTTSAAGTALGPSLGGALIAWAGWRAAFIGLVPPAIIALMLAARHLPDDRESRPRRPVEFDAGGTLVLAATLTVYALAMTQARGRPGWWNGIFLVVAAIGLGIFVRIERRSALPLVRLDLLKDSGLQAGLILSALVSAVMMATMVVGPFYLARVLGLDPARVGLVMSVGPLVAAGAGVPAGRWVDRLGATRMTALGLAGVATGTILLGLMPETARVWGYLGPIVTMTAGYALFQAANNTGLLRNSTPERRGLISGLLNLSRNLGLTTGASLMATVFAFAVGRGDVPAADPAAVASGLRLTFAVASVPMVVAVILAVRSWRSAGVPPAGDDASCVAGADGVKRSGFWTGRRDAACDLHARTRALRRL